MFCHMSMPIKVFTIMNMILSYGWMNIDIDSLKCFCLYLLMHLLIAANANNDDIVHVLTLYSQSQDEYLNQYSCHNLNNHNI